MQHTPACEAAAARSTYRKYGTPDDGRPIYDWPAGTCPPEATVCTVTDRTRP